MVRPHPNMTSYVADPRSFLSFPSFFFGGPAEECRAYLLKDIHSLVWKLLPLLSERNNAALVTAVMSVTANDSETVWF